MLTEQEIVGRDAQVRAISDWLEEGSFGVLTLCGPGGAGKTTLAAAGAARHAGKFVELAPCSTSDDIARAVAEALGLPHVLHNLAGIVAEIATASSLIVLDNAEHVVQQTAAFVSEVLAGTDARLLVTSRERLNLPEETVLELGALSVDDGVELFARHARNAAPGFELTASNRGDVADLVSLVDGLPLGIELAAARAQLLTPAQIAERLSGQFDILRARGNDLRHSTIDACVEWSWSLLDEPSRAVLMQCAMFRGSFDQTDAAEVFVTEGDLAGLLRSLAERSMLNVQGDGPPQFSLYESVRRFLARNVEDTYEAAERFGEYQRRRVTRGALRRSDLWNALHAIELNFERSPELAVRLLVEARQDLFRAGFGDRALELLERAHTVAGLSSVLAARVHAAQATCLFSMMALAECDEHLDQAEQHLADAATDEARLLRAHVNALRAQRADQRGDYAAADRYFASALAERDDLPVSREVHMLATLAFSHLQRENVTEAVRWIEDAVSVARTQGVDEALLARILGWAGQVYLFNDEQARALAVLEEALGLFAHVDDLVSQSAAEYVTALAYANSEPSRALAYAEQAATTAKRGRIPGFDLATSVLRARITGGRDSAATLRKVLREVGDAHDDYPRWTAWLSLIIVLSEAEEHEAACDEARAFVTSLDPNVHGAQLRWIQRYAAVVNLVAGRTDEVEALCVDEPDFMRALEQTRTGESTSADVDSTFDDAYLRGRHGLCPAPLAWYAKLAQRKITSRTLRLDAGGNQVVLPSGDCIDMSQRNLLRRLLVALADARDARPGVGVTTEELMAAGWPNEIVTHDSGRRRVYSAILNLRKLGLDEVLLNGEVGYLIDPDLEIVRGD